MPDPVLILRQTHVLIGAIAFVAAPAAMLTSKGGVWHRRWGKIYFAAMIGVTATAILMSVFSSLFGAGIFFFLLSILSMYAAFSGYRALILKRRAQKPGIIDWLPVTLALAGALVLIAGGIRFTFVGKAFAPILLVIGATGALVAAADMRRFFRGPTERKGWWIVHMSRMIASYIAIVTAVSVINFHFLPLPVRWLWPSVVGFPGILIWVQHYRRRFAGGVPPLVDFSGSR